MALLDKFKDPAKTRLAAYKHLEKAVKIAESAKSEKSILKAKWHIKHFNDLNPHKNQAIMVNSNGLKIKIIYPNMNEEIIDPKKLSQQVMEMQEIIHGVDESFEQIEKLSD